MKFIFFFLIALSALPTFLTSPLRAEQGSMAVPSKLFIDPSSTSTSMARINLKVGTLTRQGSAYRGGYQIKVVPFAFKNEGGKLAANVSDEAVRQLREGTPVTFTGSATSDDGQSRPIEGRATPSSNEAGRIEIRFTSKDTKLVFATTYHLAAL